MSQQTVKASSYLAGFDGLRGGGFLCVVAAHCMIHFGPESTPTGAAQVLSIGLVTFFAISGMLIYLPFARDVSIGERRTNVGLYARRRILRVYPAYLVIFVISNFVLQAVYTTNAVEAAAVNSDRGSGMMTNPLDIVLNLSLLQTFFPSTIQTGINPSWSLSAELTLYLLLPLLALPLVGVARRHPRLGFTLALVPAAILFVVGIAGRLWAEHLYGQRPGLSVFEAEYGSNGIAVLSRSILALGDNFALGMVVAVMFLRMKRGELAWLTRRLTIVSCAIVFVVSSATGILIHDSHPWFLQTCVSFASASILLVLAEANARGTKSVFVQIGEFGPIAYLGTIALSAYLWHYPMLLLASRFDLVGGDSVLSIVWSYIVVLTTSIALGAVTYRFVERPAMHWEPRTNREVSE